MDLSSWVRRAALGLGLGLVVIACGSDDDELKPTSGATTKSALIEEFCSAADECCKAEGKANDHDACVKSYTLFTSSQTYNATKGKTCLTAVKKARKDGSYCGSGSSSSAGSPGDDPCDGVFTDEGSGPGGTAKPGEPCKVDADCAKAEGATSASCLTSSTLDPDGKPKTEMYCVVEITLKVGDACGDDTKGYERSCDTKKGESCDLSASKCVAAKAEGEDCSTGASCAAGLYCASSGTTSVCAKKLAAGGSCEDSTSACADTAYCDFSTNKCADKLASGASCTTSQSCASGSCVNGACDKGSGGSTRACFPKG